MDIDDNVSRTSLGRDMKLRKWGMVLLIFVSVASLICMLRATDIPLSLPLLYGIYIIITLYILQFAKVDIFSPLMFFVLFSFLGFGLQLPILIISPNSVFFLNPSFSFHPNFEYSNVTLSFAFYVFLIGYIAFIVGFTIVKRSVKLRISANTVRPIVIATLSMILIIASFYFRSRYNIRVPWSFVSSIKHAGYIYYPLMYGSLVATSLTLYFGIMRNSVFYTVLGLLLFCLYALLGAVLGWKGSFVLPIMIIVMSYYYIDRYRLQHISKNVGRSIGIVTVTLVIVFALLYTVIGSYRTVVLIGQGKANVSSLVSSILSRNIGPIMSRLPETLNAIRTRVSYLDNLVAITTYFQQNSPENFESPAFLSNLLRIGTLPEEYYTRNILGVSPTLVTTNAPTGWGTLYIYGRVFGVLIGMMFFGIVCKLLYLTSIGNISRDGRWIVFYGIFMGNIFLNVIFEGTIVGYFDTNFVALLFVYAFFIFVLNIVHPIGYTEKLFGNGKR